MTVSYTRFDCGTIRPVFPKIQGGTYCLLVETNQGKLLIDSGYGIRDFIQPALRTRLFTGFIRTPRDTETCIINQLKSNSIDPHSVQHIVLTHMHLDHAGGVADFPWATVHVYEQEYQAALQSIGRLGIGYLQRQWRDHKRWQFYSNQDTTWFGFNAITMTCFNPQFLLIPTPGHSAGHCMVAFGSGDFWVLQCGSACYPFYLNQTSNAIQMPDWLQRWAMGPYLSPLKQLWQQHHEHITFLSGHDFVKRS